MQIEEGEMVLIPAKIINNKDYGNVLVRMCNRFVTFEHAILHSMAKDPELLATAQQVSALKAKIRELNAEIDTLRPAAEVNA